MTLLETLLQISDQSQSANQPTDLEFGTVTAVGPLEITRDVQQAPLKASVLILTEAVVEKKIPILNHIHKITGLDHKHGDTPIALDGTYPTMTSLVSEDYDASLQTQNIVCWENGEQLPIENGFIILNRALEVGDRVVMLKVQKGQRFIVLSRVFEQ